MKAFIRIRGGSYSYWNSSNTILKEREISVVTSGEHFLKMKFGDGKTPWRQLSFSAARFPEDILSLNVDLQSSELPTTGNVIDLFQQIRNFLKYVKNMFDPNIDTGHTHNGLNSARISYNNLTDTFVITDYVDNNILRLESRIENVENLGQIVGVYDTAEEIPTNKSDFINGVTLNDWVKIRQDENYNGASTAYTIIDIDNESGLITWEHTFTYDTDISGKMDILPDGTIGNLLQIGLNGNAEDSGKKLSDLTASSLNREIKVDDSSSTNSLTDTGETITIPLSAEIGTINSSSTQISTGRQSLRYLIQTLANNIRYLFNNFPSTYTPTPRYVHYINLHPSDLTTNNLAGFYEVYFMLISTTASSLSIGGIIANLGNAANSILLASGFYNLATNNVRSVYAIGTDGTNLLAFHHGATASSPLTATLQLTNVSIRDKIVTLIS